MIITTQAPKIKGERKAPRIDLGLRKDMNDADLPRFTFYALPQKQRGDWDEVVEKPDARALVFLKGFAEDADKGGIEVIRVSDIVVALQAGSHRISMRSQNKWEFNTLGRFEGMQVQSKFDKDGVIINVRNLPSSGNESSTAPEVAKRKTYEQMSDEDLATECVTRGLDPYVETPDGNPLKTNIRPRSKLIKDLRAHDAASK